MKLKHLIWTLSTVCLLSFTGAALVFHTTALLAGDASTTFEVEDSQEISLDGITAIEITGQVAMAFMPAKIHRMPGKYADQ